MGKILDKIIKVIAHASYAVSHKEELSKVRRIKREKIIKDYELFEEIKCVDNKSQRSTAIKKSVVNNLTLDNMNITQVVVAYLSDTKLRSEGEDKISDYIIKISGDKDKEEELRLFIKNNINIDPKDRIDLLLEKINNDRKTNELFNFLYGIYDRLYDILDGDYGASTKRVRIDIDNIVSTYSKQDLNMAMELLRNYNKVNTEEDYTKLINMLESVKGNKIDRYYALYNRRLEELAILHKRLEKLEEEYMILYKKHVWILGESWYMTTDNVDELTKKKSEVVNLRYKIGALSNRIKVLKRIDIEREYKWQCQRREDSSHLFGIFNEEELDRIYKSGFYKDPEKVDSAAEFKKIMQK